MHTLTLRREELKGLAGIQEIDFPKYTTQIINLANQNAQGTRPKVVGQMSELINEFPGRELDEWSKWYQLKKSDAIKAATKRISHMIECFRTAIKTIDDELIEQWVTDLVINKTFIGMKFQKSILIAVSRIYNATWRLSTPDEESRGIDGYIGNKAVSIKPDTYATMNTLPETISCPIIIYTKSEKEVYVDYSALERNS